MADNVTLPGTGELIGTDDVGGVQYQQVKLVDSRLGGSDPIGNIDNPLPVAGSSAGGYLLRILQMLLAPLGYDKSLGRYRQTAILESGTVTTVTTVTTCSTVTNLSTIDTLQGRIMVYGANMSAWSDCVRSRIT